MNFYHLATLVNWFHSISDMLSLRRTVILFISRLILVKLSSPTCSYDRTENQTTTKSKNVLRQWRKFFARALSKFSFVIRERNFAFSFMISLRLSQTLNGWCSRGFLLGERGWMFVSSFANIFTYLVLFKMLSQIRMSVCRQLRSYSKKPIAVALRSKKPKSSREMVRKFDFYFSRPEMLKIYFLICESFNFWFLSSDTIIHGFKTDSSDRRKRRWWCDVVLTVINSLKMFLDRNLQNKIKFLDCGATIELDLTAVTADMELTLSSKQRRT